MGIHINVKSSSSFFKTSEVLTIERLGQLIEDELIIGKFSAIDHREFEDYDEASISLDEFGYVYVGLENQSARGVSVYYDPNNKHYEFKLAQPCNASDASLLERLTKAVSNHFNQPLVFVNGSFEEANDIMIHWNNLIQFRMEEDLRVGILGVNVDIWVDNNFLSQFQSGNELYDYYFKHQWQPDVFVASPQFMQPRKDFVIGLWVNTMDLPTIYPLSPTIPDYYSINPLSVNWFIALQIEELSLTDRMVKYQDFINYVEKLPTEPIGVNHFVIALDEAVSRDILTKHSIKEEELTGN